MLAGEQQRVAREKSLFAVSADCLGNVAQAILFQLPPKVSIDVRGDSRT
jgi:hypothetical protein